MLQRSLAAALAAWLALAPVAAEASQNSLFSPTVGTVSGLQLTNNYNNAIDSLNTTNSGSSAPANQLSGVPSLGNRWLDTSANPSGWKTYDGTSWVWPGYLDQTNHVWDWQIGGGNGTIASAATVDLCSVPQAVIQVTGTTTVTSFGSSCYVGQIKVLRFASALILTNNNTSLMLPGRANITTAANDVGLAEYEGSGNWRVLSYQPVTGSAISNTGSPVAGIAKNLKITNGATPNNQGIITADEATLEDAGGNIFRATSVSCTADVTASGAGGLDTGSVAGSQWYSVWLIYNASGPTLSCLFSVATGVGGSQPTLPAGYTFKARFGWMRTDGSNHFYRTLQIGSLAHWQLTNSTNTTSAVPIINGAGTSANCGSASPTYENVSLAAGVPATAVAAELILWGNYNGSGSLALVLVAPNANYGGTGTNTTNPPYAGTQNSTFGIPTDVMMMLETAQQASYCGNGANSSLWVSGWRDAQFGG